MEFLCSRITEVDPARVEALHHFDIEPCPISWRTHRFQNVLPSRFRRNRPDSTASIQHGRLDRTCEGQQGAPGRHDDQHRNLPGRHD